MRFLISVLCAILLTGCVTTNRQYQWGDYEGMLYSSYKDPEKVEALKLALEAQISQLEQNKQKVPPGLYAELGTLYLQKGSQDKAIVMYGKERDSWPESMGLMTAMIQNLERQKQSPEEGAK